MAVVLVAFVIVLLLFGAGFALHFLWWIALAALALWLIGWVFGAAEGGSRRGWYGR
jgi:hypothetical protein